jgi:profilin
MKNIADVVSGEGGAKDKAFAEGIHIAGERFVLVERDGSFYGRKV